MYLLQLLIAANVQLSAQIAKYKLNILPLTPKIVLTVPIELCKCFIELSTYAAYQEVNNGILLHQNVNTRKYTQRSLVQFHAAESIILLLTIYDYVFFHVLSFLGGTSLCEALSMLQTSLSGFTKQEEQQEKKFCSVVIWYAKGVLLVRFSSR